MSARVAADAWPHYKLVPSSKLALLFCMSGDVSVHVQPITDSHLQSAIACIGAPTSLRSYAVVCIHRPSTKLVADDAVSRVLLCDLLILNILILQAVNVIGENIPLEIWQYTL